MFSSLKSTFNQYKNIIKNSLFLSIVDGVKMLLPFIAMPYIIRVCGVENFGRIIFAQTVIGYFTIAVNFGLNIFTVKEVANNLDNRQKLSCITSTFIALRLLLVLLCFIVLCLLLTFVPFFQQFKLLLLFAFVASVAEIFNMTAFFQGMEKMHNIAVLQLIAVVFYIVTLFVFVREAASYELIPLLQALGLLIAAMLGVVMLYLKYKIKFVLPGIGDICTMAKSSFPFAMSRIAIIINTNTAKFFTGLSLGMHDLAVLDIVQKISGAAMIPANIIDQAIYPHNAKHKDRKFATKTFYYMILLGGICAGLMAAGAAPAVHFLGHGELNEAIPLLYLLTANVIVATLSFYEGTPVLVAFGYAKPFNKAIILSSFVTMFSYYTTYYLNLLSPIAIIVIIMFNETFIAAYMFYCCYKYKILFNNIK